MLLILLYCILSEGCFIGRRFQSHQHKDVANDVPCNSIEEGLCKGSNCYYCPKDLITCPEEGTCFCELSRSHGPFLDPDKDVGRVFPKPQFQEVILDKPTEGGLFWEHGGPIDGYFLIAADIDGDGWKDIVTSGLARGVVSWYRNPATKQQDWIKYNITQFGYTPVNSSDPKSENSAAPVAFDLEDIDLDGDLDIAITYNYGGCGGDCDPTVGDVMWLENPGLLNLLIEKSLNFSRFGAHGGWTRHYIGHAMSAHRVYWGHWTTVSAERQLLLVPVNGFGTEQGFQGGMGWDWHGPIRILLWERPANPKDPLNSWGWTPQVVDSTHFIAIHSVWHDRFLKYQTNNQLDSMVIANEHGLQWLHYNENLQHWQIEHLHHGTPLECPFPPGNSYSPGLKGTGQVAVCKTREDEFAFIATLEPFHGWIFSIYTKENPLIRNQLDGTKWIRTEIERYGPSYWKLQGLISGEGSGHMVYCEDFDGDGNDEILVGARGPLPWSGVFYYKISKEGIPAGPYHFSRTRITKYSTARITVDDFNNDGYVDFGLISYYTPGYYESAPENTRVALYLNQKYGEQTPRPFGGNNG